MGAVGVELDLEVALPPVAAGSAEDLLARYLAHRDVPCPVCKYNLRDVKTAACPECGDPLVLKISRRARKAYAFYGLAFPAYVAAAYSVAMTAIVIGLPLMESKRVSVANALIAGGLMLVLATAAILLRRHRKQLMRGHIHVIRKVRWFGWAGLVLAIALTCVLFWQFGEKMP